MSSQLSDSVYSVEKQASGERVIYGEMFARSSKRRSLTKKHAGVNTGFGGSADLRTSDHLGLERALMQLLQSGVSIASDRTSDPFSTAFESFPRCMPLPWVRATIVARLNQCIRGHSAISRQVVQAIVRLLHADILPVVPLRGSISASGDLMPLSYLAGVLEGNPDVFVHVGSSGRIVSAPEALKDIGMSRLTLGPREGLGLINGTAASVATASLAVHDAAQLALLTTLVTCLVSEGLAARPEWLDPFVSEIQPHVGQTEVSNIMREALRGSLLVTGINTTSKSAKLPLRPEGGLSQDRYALRTAPH